VKSNSLTRLSNQDLTSGLAAAAARERTSTAELVAYIAEFDSRGLYRPAGYPSMHLYCESVLGLSQDSAYKRIQVARAARHFPQILEALEDGRLHLTGANLLAPYLTMGNAADLIAASAGKTKWDIQRLLADRFPSSESLQLIESSPREPAGIAALVPGSQGNTVKESSCQLAPAQVRECSIATKIVPSAPQRFSVHLSFGQEMLDDLRHAQHLLGHSGSSDTVEVIHRGLKSLIRELEKRKFAATDRPRARRERPSANPQSIPAQVMREVWRRDGGRCTFVGDHGMRCPARAGLEFDHIQPVALGGPSSTANVRLLCRAHNQYAAEQVFGADRMKAKREEAARERKEAGRRVSISSA
jgi:5-methylcytosine-specific restriction endonuclease McrA